MLSFTAKTLTACAVLTAVAQAGTVQTALAISARVVESCSADLPASTNRLQPVPAVALERLRVQCTPSISYRLLPPDLQPKVVVDRAPAPSSPTYITVEF